MMKAATPMTVRRRSGVRVRAIPHTAWATTATATSFRPWITAWAQTPLMNPTPKANTVIKIADGKVKPAQAANAPGQPARRQPRPKPTWLDAGPGRNWLSATRSA